MTARVSSAADSPSFGTARARSRRVLFVIHYPEFGGPHNQALQMAGRLASLGWDLIVLLPTGPSPAADRLREAGIEVAQVPLSRLRATLRPDRQLRYAASVAGDVTRIRRLLREREVEIVMLAGLVNTQAAIASSLQKVALVWQLLDTRAPKILAHAIMPLVTRLADVVMSTGSLVADLHPGATALAERLVTFMPPVDLEKFRANSSLRESARRELGLTHDDVVIGTVGNLNPQKGHSLFVRAALILRKSHPRARFVILGAGYEQHQTYLEVVLNEAAAGGLVIGVDLIVREPGPDVFRLAQAFDIFWMTSEPRSEGVPTALEEAMALGLPVLSTDVGGVREAIEDGVSGYVVPPGGADALARNTSVLLDDAHARRRMGELARRRAELLFGVDRCVANHVRAFELALQRRDGKARTSLRP